MSVILANAGCFDAQRTITPDNGILNLRVSTGVPTVTRVPIGASFPVGAGGTSLAVQPIVATSEKQSVFPNLPPIGSGGSTALITAGTPSLVWYGSDGAATFWRMNATVWSGSGATVLQIPPPWRLATSADLNSNGHPDLVWENTSDGLRAVTYMTGGAYAGSYTLMFVIPPEWKIIASADFDGNNKTDLVLSNTVTGDNGVLYLSDTTWTGVFAPLPNFSPSARLSQVGDMNGDSKPDLIVQNIANGQPSIYFMNGTTVTSSGAVAVTPGSAWKIGAVGDFDGDAKNDLVVQNTTDGSRSIWLMNAAVRNSEAILPAVATTSTIVSAALIQWAPLLGRDFSIVGAQFTQGVQNAAGTIPMVVSGDAAVVNVLLRATPSSTTPMQLVLRLLNSVGALVYSDTAVASSALGSTPTYSAPSAQFLVPSSALQGGRSWQVVRDPRNVVPDDSAVNDVYPRGAPLTLGVVNVPALNIRFVPIVLAAHGNATGNVTDANIPSYLRTLKSVHPLGAINTHVGTLFTTNASFGTAPTGGSSAFWQQVLGELDLARIADPVEPDANWYGIVLPPPGFTYTNSGGIAYIPVSGTATGAGTRTSLSVQVGWFSNATQARELVAHELGHTFGRRHAPCGGAGSPDPNYPVAGGLLDQPGHDVFSWATGLTAFAPTIPATTGDVMGYCSPVWASAYTYSGVLQFRSSVAAAATQGQATNSRVLIMRGVITLGKSLELEPAFALDARASLPERSGEYSLEGLGVDGRVLFTYSFAPAEIDHAAGIRHFAIAMPLTPAIEAALETLVLRGPEGEVRRTRAPQRAGSAQIGAVRMSDGQLSLSCADGATRGILVLDGTTGSVLGSASASSLRALGVRGKRLRVVCSDGVAAHEAAVIAP